MIACIDLGLIFMGLLAVGFIVFLLKEAFEFIGHMMRLFTRRSEVHMNFSQTHQYVPSDPTGPDWHEEAAGGVYVADRMRAIEAQSKRR